MIWIIRKIIFLFVSRQANITYKKADLLARYFEFRNTLAKRMSKFN